MASSKRDLGAEVIRVLTPDLLKPEYRNQEHPLAGHCYVASEALYHLSGRTLRPYFVRHEGKPHWFLKDEQGRIIDLTAAQFATPVPYEQGRGRGFLTRRPSRRAQVVIERIRRLSNQRPGGELNGNCGYHTAYRCSLRGRPHS